MGQLKADDRISFYPLTVEQANTLEQQQIERIENFAHAALNSEPPSSDIPTSAILASLEATDVSHTHGIPPSG